MEALLSPTESYYIPGATQAVENSTKIRLYGGSVSSLVGLPRPDLLKFIHNFFYANYLPKVAEKNLNPVNVCHSSAPYHMRKVVLKKI